MAGPKFSDVTELYGENYQADSIAAERRASWEHIAATITAWYARVTWADDNTFLDIGCGAGPLVKAMRAEGWDAWGIEGSLAALNKSDERIIPWDLRVPLTVLRPFELVTCFDTGEHVGNAEALVATCDTAADSLLLFGAAGVGQEGHGHIDCRDDWPELFLPCGFDVDAEETEALRSAIRAVEIHNKIWWIEKNLVVYRR